MQIAKDMERWAKKHNAAKNAQQAAFTAAEETKNAETAEFKMVSDVVV